MRTLRDIFLQMNAHEAHLLIGRHDIFLRVFGVSKVVQRYAPVSANRHVILRNLVIFRHVWIKVIFPVELADRRNVASQHKSGEHGHAQRFMIHHRQRAGQTEAHRASVCVRLRPKFNR